MNLKRRKTRTVKIGSVNIGSAHPVAIQSMSKFKTSDVENTIRQIKGLERAGCEIIRVAVKDNADAEAIKLIKAEINIPLVADIHFDWRLAILAIDNGADKIRLNPGNINKSEEIKAVVAALKNAKIPLRIGLNSGSVKGRPGKSMPEKLSSSALNYIKIIERLKFHDLVISLKANSVVDTVEAYRKMAKLCDYPLHLGVTATGTPFAGAIKSAVAIGALLLEGIGDTIRVSLTDDPIREIEAARDILESLGLRSFGPQIVSCPTCGRCDVDLVKIVRDLEDKLKTENWQLKTKPLKVAVMGCVVNGPGEALEADIGVAFGKNEGMLFKKGKAVRKISYNDCVAVLLKEMEKMHG
ncbi:MAG: flavodoxin-dependent (E)-4-hydroxy-3-methylbut-2-enyl-diphosphate synthase [Candidatus Omnitrophica bacterium]|nr:flavodoxin-dependent (E)-4-hydroxy-3-methylbut-2-enyl-diphosphate synthase [Candidatus Omnitrophota bacterium]